MLALSFAPINRYKADLALLTWKTVLNGTPHKDLTADTTAQSKWQRTPQKPCCSSQAVSIRRLRNPETVCLARQIEIASKGILMDFFFCPILEHFCGSFAHFEHFCPDGVSFCPDGVSFCPDGVSFCPESRLPTPVLYSTVIHPFRGYVRI